MRLAPALNIKPGWLYDVHPDAVSDEVMEIWNDIPEDQRGHALQVLNTFARRRR